MPNGNENEILMQAVIETDRAIAKFKELEAYTRTFAANVTKEGRARIDLRIDDAKKKLDELWTRANDMLSMATRFNVTKWNILPSSVLAEAEKTVGSVERLLSSLKEKAEKQDIKWLGDTNRQLRQFDDLERRVLSRLDRMRTKAEGKAIEPILNAGKAIGELDKLDAAAKRSMDRLREEVAKDPLKGLEADAARNAQALLREFSRLETRFKTSVARLNEASSRVNFDPASAQAVRLRENVRIMADQMIAFVRRIPPELQKMGGGFNGVAAAVANAKVQLQAFSGLPTAPIKSFASSVFNLANSVRVFLGGLAVQRLYEFGKSAFEASTKMETLHKTLTAVLGGSASATASISHIKETADSLGLSFEILADTYTTFTVAATQAGLTLQQSTDIFDAVAVAAGAMRLESTQLEHVFLALEQMLSKGVVAAEELRRQLGNVLPGAFSIMAQSLNVSTQELEHMMRTAGLITNDVLPKFAARLLDVFGKGAIAQAQTARAELERMRNEFFFMEQQVGDRLVPELKDLMSVFITLGKDGKESFDSIGDAMAGVVDKLTSVLNLVRDVLGGNLKGLLQELQAMIVSTLSTTLSFVANLAASIGSIFSKSLGEAIRKGSAEQIAAMTDLAEGLKEKAKETRDGYKTLAEETNAVSSAVAGKIEEVKKRLVDSMKENKQATAETTKELEKAAKAAESFAESSEGTVEALNKRTAAIVEGTAKIEADGVVTVKTAEAIKKAVEEQLAAYEKAGVDAPTDLLRIADAYGALSSKAAEARDAAVAFQKSVEGDAAAIAKRTEAIVNGIAMAERDGVVTAAAKDKIVAAVKEQLDAYDQLGEAAPAALQEIADRYGVVSTAQATLTKAIEETSKALEEASEKVREAQAEFDKIGEQVEKIPDEIRRMKEELAGIDNKIALEPEDMSRREELRTKLRDAEKAFSKEAAQARADAEEQASEKIRRAREAEEEAMRRKLDAFWAQQAKLREDEAKRAERDRAKTDASLGSSIEKAGEFADAQREAADATGDLADGLGDLEKPIRDAVDPMNELRDSAAEIVQSGRDMEKMPGMNPLIAQAQTVLRLAPLVAEAMTRIQLIAAQIRMGG